MGIDLTPVLGTSEKYFHARTRKKRAAAVMMKVEISLDPVDKESLAPEEMLCLWYPLPPLCGVACVVKEAGLSGVLLLLEAGGVGKVAKASPRELFEFILCRRYGDIG